MRVIFYALNGVGLGHLVRLCAIAKSMRKISEEHGANMEILFVTSSESDQLLFKEGFACFKIPSRLMVERIGLDYLDYKNVACNVVRSIIDNLSPDLLVVDTAPMGSFGEFAPDDKWDFQDCCRSTAFIFRPVRRSVAERPTFAFSVKRYDLVVVPENELTVDPYIVSSLDGARIKYVGPILSIDRRQFSQRDEIRKGFNLDTGEIAIFVSTGGGGYINAEKQIVAICEALSTVPQLKLLVAPGTLYPGNRVSHPNIFWCEPADAKLAMYASDLAVSAAGYNTFYELMHLGVPAIFIPLTSSADDQTERAMRAANFGAAQVLPMTFRNKDLVKAVERLLDAGERTRVSERAKKIAPTNCVAVAARELFNLLLSG